MQIDGDVYSFIDDELSYGMSHSFREGAVFYTRISSVEVARLGSGELLMRHSLNIHCWIRPLVDRVCQTRAKLDSSISVWGGM